MTEVLADIGYLILTINLILFSIRFSDYGKAFKVFTVYTAIIFIIQMSANIFNYLHIHNLFLSHFYFIFQFIALSGFYYIILRERFQKNIVKVGMLLVTVALGAQYLSNPGLFFKFNLFEIFITSFLLIIYATFHFYNLLNDKKEFYYINMGILIYLFGSTALFLAGNLVASLSSAINTITWTCNAILYIVYQAFILVEWKKSFARKNQNRAHDS